MKIRQGDRVEDTDVILLQRQFDELHDEFKLHQSQENERWKHLLDLTEQNTMAAQKNAESISKLTDSTAGLLDAWNTAVGVKKAGTALGSFIKWIGSLGILGAAIMWIAEKLQG
jgi:hypothetical protein